MTIQDFYDYCLQLNGVTEHFPFDEDTLVLKVGGKMFALTSLSDWEKGNASINLKCDPEKAIAFRQEYEGIIPGYHMNKKHWNTVNVHSDVPMALLLSLINDSYTLVVQSLPKKEQLRIQNLES